MRMHKPVHPGWVLREYLGDTSVTEAAKRLGVTRAALSRILNGKAAVSADMAVRLSILLGTSSEMWAGMQTQYDLWQAEQKPHDFVVPLNVASA
ncbi:HigA family addiction module antitoxin [Uruburuella testudinis]|uniref:HigA family addiction module antitoxin n=1 Tax=Uruburuella testudinis TaxID=1282863 RepID=A0ABY4DTD6_9NEIS|nr:HigA family addiction module antitoxin [Uruburuella testudinis]UOO81862.1 HigA family addiction module antitoxin [Uruburuella testudinis]